MAQKYVSVLDFGSSKISVMIAESGINNTFNILGSGEAKYAGFLNGAFVEPEKLHEAIANCILKAETNSGLKIEKLHFNYYDCALRNYCSYFIIRFSAKIN